MARLLLVMIVLLAVSMVAGCGQKSVKMARAEYGNKWPLTADEGVVTYDKGVLFTVAGVTYTVNGTAMGSHPDLPRLYDICKEDPSLPGRGVKMDCDFILQKGLELQ